MTVAELDRRDRIAREVKDVNEGGNQLHFPFRETDQPVARVGPVRRPTRGKRNVASKRNSDAPSADI
jgi:hypothetical protein